MILNNYFQEVMIKIVDTHCHLDFEENDNDIKEEDKMEKVMQNIVESNKDSMYYLDIKPGNSMVVQDSEIDTESSVSPKKDDSVSSEMSFY